jgi:DNA-directed RNA polymerase specialized sigma24 family protein
VPQALPRHSPSAERLVDEHVGSLFSAACLILSDHGEAASATVAAFVDAWSAPARSVCEPGRRELARYLYFECAHQRAADSTADTGARSLEGSGCATIPAQGSMSQHQRSVLALALFGALTCQQIADLIHLPTPTVANLIRSGLRNLR